MNVLIYNDLKNSYLSHISFRILILFFLSMLLSCGSDSDTGNSELNDKVGVSLPQNLKMALPANGQLNAYLSLDGGQRQAMNVNVSDNNANISLGGLATGSHKVKIEFEFVYNNNPANPITLASVTRTLALGAGSNSLSIGKDDYTTSGFDWDGDGIDNLQELIDGTSPIARVVVSTISGNTSEDGGSASFSLVLSSLPAANVDLSVQSTNQNEGDVDISQVTFTPANWNMPQVITVTGVNDNLNDGDVVYQITLSAAVSTDADYSNYKPADITLTNIDNPTASVLPVDSSLLNGASLIVIFFGREMDPVLLTLSGSMNSDGGVWSSVSVINDTLSIKPKTRWAEGAQTLSFNAFSIDGVELGVQTINYTVDDSAPTVTFNPASGAAIQNKTPVAIIFSDSMQKSSFLASGDIWNESDQTVIWSSQVVADDTATLNPASSWKDGSKSLVLSANDLAGNALVTQSASYTVDTTIPGIVSITPNGLSPAVGVLSTGTSVKIEFTKSMSVTSLKASGSLWNESDQGLWSSSKGENNNILTLSPAKLWSLSAKTLTLDVSDINANKLATLTLNYSVGCPVGTSIDLCSSGFDDCNSNYADGCEVNLTNDDNNCKSCGNICNDVNACTIGTCSASQCSAAPSDSLCGADSVVLGACAGSTTCSYTGTQTRTVTPKICTANGCANGTSSSTTVSCVIKPNPDGSSCGAFGYTCGGGSCLCPTCVIQ